MYSGVSLRVASLDAGMSEDGVLRRHTLPFESRVAVNLARGRRARSHIIDVAKSLLQASKGYGTNRSYTVMMELTS